MAEKLLLALWRGRRVGPSGARGGGEREKSGESGRSGGAPDGREGVKVTDNGQAGGKSDGEWCQRVLYP